MARQIDSAGRVLVFTGAGVSTGSGIPDFRGPDGLWTKFKPVYYQDFLSSHEHRLRHWKYKAAGWREFRDARPNLAHQALFDLDRLGKLDCLVTQNIDGLHQLAGHAEEKIIELHGTNRKIKCLDCDSYYDPAEVFAQFDSEREPPVCKKCGGFLKPATVSFGEPMPVEKLDRAMQEAERADLVLAVGSTLEVEPAASVPRRAAHTGAFYAILNRGTTAQDHLADLRIDEDVTRFLPAVVARLKDA